ncbi:hypothetical protein QR685DRAFT_541929 [Neurospora intermedia]|uniref:Uncharacterized protein n=1 Tax=Neurospora intermedia TaxID=5142 RepID=A0ABR3DKV2_NEUIN
MVDAKPGDSLDSMVWSSRTDLDVETSRVGSLSRVPKEAITNGSRAWTAGLGYTEASKWVGDKRGDQLLNGAFYNKGYERKRREKRTKEKVGNKSATASLSFISLDEAMKAKDGRRPIQLSAVDDKPDLDQTQVQAIDVDFQIGG